MNEAKLQEFMGKVVTDMGGAWMMAMVLIGDELGLYKAMADGKPVTAEALATRSGCHSRLVREWLDANAASGYLEAADGAYRLPPEQAMALANVDSPVFVAPGQSVVASCFMDLDKILRRSGAVAQFPGAPITTGCSTAPSSSFVLVIRRISPRHGCRPSREWSTSSSVVRRWRTSDAATARPPSSWRRPIPTLSSWVSTPQALGRDREQAHRRRRAWPSR
jgi:Rv2258c-like winged HTH domain